MAIVALLIAIMGLSVAYAAYSQTLKISGSGKINKAQWNVKFNNLQPPITAKGAVSTKAPALDETSTIISGFEATLTAPGSSISYQFDVENKGNIDAILTDYILGTLKCTKSAESNATDDQVNAICEKLHYTLNYSDNNEIAVNNLLNKNETKTLILKLYWDETSETKADGNIDVAIGDTILTYGQN